MAFLHKNLAAGRWHELSLAEQLGNIGSEVFRASRHERDEAAYEGAILRALELFDLTLSDPRWAGRRREIARAREVFCDAISGGPLYRSTLRGLTAYFDAFAIAARNGR